MQRGEQNGAAAVCAASTVSGVWHWGQRVGTFGYVEHVRGAAKSRWRSAAVSVIASRAMTQGLLLEIGVEELPASFVAAALEALPVLLTESLRELRLGHGAVRALGTPRRLALLVEQVMERQPDLDEEVLGPPARVAFDAQGAPTKAAESFALKTGVALESLQRVVTPKGEYVAARRQVLGRAALELLPGALEQLCGKIPFRKSMRWGAGETAFGRPVRWIVALLGAAPLRFCFAGVESGVLSSGHRFLGEPSFPVGGADTYVEQLRAQHVLVDGAERRRVMQQRLLEAAAQLGGQLIEDEFLVEENLSLVEEPQVLVGGFSRGFLELPERVILDVAKGHQRYFGVRGPDGELLPNYLAVVNTARCPENIRRGNDRVMRARLSDAKFFWDEDRKLKLASRRPKLDGITFHQRLGSVGDKVRRMEAALPALASALGLTQPTLQSATAGAALAKCDLVSLMVGELPELQGEMGRAYALLEGYPVAVADVIHEHYQPRSAEDRVAPSAAGALVALADRLDTLVGCFAVGIAPTGSADPLALRRAALGVLRILLAHQWDVAVTALLRISYGSLAQVALDLELEPLVSKLGAFFTERLRGLLEQGVERLGEAPSAATGLPKDVVEACLAAGADRVVDALRRAETLAGLDATTRARAGEVFKRAANIAKEAPEGARVPPESLGLEVHPSEQALFEGTARLERRLAAAATDYPAAFAAVEEFAPLLSSFFNDVFVMDDNVTLRNNRLRLMRDVQRACARLAAFNALAR